MNFDCFEKVNIIKYNFPLSTICTMKTGGCAKYAFFPENTKQLSDIILFVRENGIKYKILGNGSNTIFKDSGYDGAVIVTLAMKSLYDIKEGAFCEFSDDYCASERLIYASCGYSLTSLSSRLSRLGYCGLEFAYGIPASVGGAVFMNAGAYGGEMKDVIYSVEYMCPDGKIEYMTDCGNDNYFGYRHSYFSEHPEFIITGVILRLVRSTDSNPMDLAERNMKARKEKQPLEYPSCGSAFKRPDGYFAGALIEQAGLKGKNIGGAYVSEKHAGFIVNKGGATTQDVLNLLDYVKDKVYKNSGVMLEPEIRVVED